MRILTKKSQILKTCDKTEEHLFSDQQLQFLLRSFGKVFCMPVSLQAAPSISFWPYSHKLFWIIYICFIPFRATPLLNRNTKVVQVSTGTYYFRKEKIKRPVASVRWLVSWSPPPSNFGPCRPYRDSLPLSFYLLPLSPPLYFCSHVVFLQSFLPCCFALLLRGSRVA